MKKDASVGLNISFIIRVVLVGLAVAAAFMLIFAVLMYYFENMFLYAPVFATVSLAPGSLAAAYSAARKIGKRGFFIGLVVGGITFVAVTLISLIADDGGFTLNTLFHFITVMLSSLIGGISGVNGKRNRKYI